MQIICKYVGTEYTVVYTYFKLETAKVPMIKYMIIITEVQ